MPGAIAGLKVSLGLDAVDFVEGFNKADAVAAKFAEKQARNATAIDRTVKALEQQAANAGKTASEIKHLELVQRGATEAQLASAAAALKTIDSHRIQTIKPVSAEADSASAKFAEQQARNVAAINSTIKALEQQAATVGKTASEIKRLELVQRGATASQLASADASLKTIDNHRTQNAGLSLLESGLERQGIALKKTSDYYATFAYGQKLTAFQSAQLNFQLHDLFVQVVSGQSPIVALIQQGSQLNGTFGGLQGTLNAVASIFTPVRLAIGGVAAAAAALGAVLYFGGKESIDFAKNMTLTGGVAGITEGQFRDAAASIASFSNTGIRSSKETLQELIDTGRFSSDVLTAAGISVQGLAKQTKESSSKIISDFVALSQNTAKGAEALNDRFNFLSATQLKYIKTLEDTGDTQKALSTIFDALNTRLEKTETLIGRLGKGWQDYKNYVSDFYNNLLTLSNTKTPEDIAKAGKERLAYLDSPGPANLSPKAAAGFAAEREALVKSLEINQRIANAEKEKAKAKEAGALAERAKTEFLKESEKSLDRASIREREIAKVRGLAEQSKGGKDPVTPDELKKAIANINEKYKDPKGSKSAADQSEFKADLDEKIKAIQVFATRQKDAFEFANRYVEGAYTEGLLSLKEFYETEKTIRAAGLDAAITANAQEITLREAAVKVFKKATDKVKEQRELDAAVEKGKDLVIKANNVEVLAAQKHQQAVLQVQLQYDALVATVKTLSGDTLGAALSHIPQQVEDARRTLTKQNADPALADTLGAKLEQAAHLADVQKNYNTLLEQTRNAEEAIALAAQVSGATELDVLRSVGVERVKALDKLKDLALAARDLALALKTPEAIAFAAALANGFAKAAIEVSPLLLKVRDLGKQVGESIANSFEQALVSGKGLRSVLQGLGDDLLRIATRSLITKPFGDYLTNKFAGPAGGDGGFLGKLFGFGSGAAGGAGALATSQAATGNAFGSFFNGFLADGGPVQAGGNYIVGERGPERFIPKQAGTIIPNNLLNQVGNGSEQSISVTNNFTLQQPTDRRTQAQIAGAAAVGVRRGLARVG